MSEPVPEIVAADVAGGAQLEASGESPAARRTKARLAVQAAGFLIGLGLLWWCAAEALKPENRSQLARLGEATTWQVAGMVALSLLTITLNGTLFWVTLRPVKRLRWGDLVAVNAIASLLALVPFKLSVLFRVLVHRQRDGVPLLTIGAWFAAMAVILLSVVAPTAAVAVWAAERAANDKAVPAWWPALPPAAALLAAAALVLCSRFFGHGAGWRLIEGIAARTPTAKGRAVVVGQLLPKAQEGARMLGAPGHVLGAAGLRLADIAVQTARFLLAAHIVGQPLSPELAVLAASAYFLIGAMAPTGALGVREAGTAGVFALLATEGFMVIVIMVTAAETVVLLGAAAVAAAWLRPDRLVGRKPRRG